MSKNIPTWPHRWFCACLLALGVPLLAVLMRLGTPSEAQTCTTPPQSPNGQTGTWQQNAPVRVNINSSQFTADERNCLAQSFANWNAANRASGNNSGVEFIVEFGSIPLASLNSNNQVVGEFNAFQVNRGNTSAAPAQVYPDSAPTSDNHRSRALVNIHPNTAQQGTAQERCTALTNFMAHEIGHTLGLGDVSSGVFGTSVMMGAPCAVPGQNPCTAGPDYNRSAGRGDPTSCDNTVSRQTGNYNGAVCETNARSNCELSGGIWFYWSCSCDFPGSGGGCTYDPCADIIGCYECDMLHCVCTRMQPSPVVVDVDGDGFSLTDGAGGVEFDLNTDGIRERLPWTAAGGDDAFLVLDRNGNGLVDNGQVLFGNYTPQPPGSFLNGFRALAEFDRPAQGGNDDGFITGADAVFAALRLWRDANHDGLSEPAELQPLASLNLLRLHLAYKESKRTDEYGNLFRYRAKVDDGQGSKVGRWAWDVFFAGAPPTPRR